MWVSILCCRSRFSFSICLAWYGSQRQLSIVVSDWEPYLGSLFSHFELWVIIFRFSVCFGFHLFSCSFVFCVQFIQYIVDTYHAAHWSKMSCSSSEEEENRYTSWLMSWDVASIYPHNWPSLWCHLFCGVHQSLLQQSTPTTWCCHPSTSRLGWCSSACKPPPLTSQHNEGHYGLILLWI